MEGPLLHPSPLRLHSPSTRNLSRFQGITPGRMGIQIAFQGPREAEGPRGPRVRASPVSQGQREVKGQAGGGKEGFLHLGDGVACRVGRVLSEET